MPRGDWDTTTRSDLLRQRGYPPDVIAGNGHAKPATDEQLSTTVDSAPVANVRLTPERTCAAPGCDNELTARQTMFCSRACAGRSIHASGTAAFSQKVRNTPKPINDLAGLLAAVALLPPEVTAVELGDWRLVRR
jgi:hypothetical protein